MFAHLMEHSQNKLLSIQDFTILSLEWRDHSRKLKRGRISQIGLDKDSKVEDTILEVIHMCVCVYISILKKKRQFCVTIKKESLRATWVA